jgi:hypothetical protein
LTKLVYNITSFSLTAEEFQHIVLEHFPNAKIDFKPHLPGRASSTHGRRMWMTAPPGTIGNGNRNMI